MTLPNEAAEAIYLRFETAWGVTTPVQFENEEFEEPVSDPWVRLVIRTRGRSQSTLGRVGNRRFRSRAAVFVQVYTTVDIGVQRSGELAEQAKVIFDAVGFSGLDFQAAVSRETGPSGKWYQAVVEAPFEYDEIK